MLFMVIEHFRDRDAAAVYGRVRQQGRMMPEGLVFRDSWVTADLGRCFQIVECEDTALFQQWVAQWTDLVEFEIIPIAQGTQTAIAIAAVSPMD